MGSLILLELLISGGINYLLQKAQVDALIERGKLVRLGSMEMAAPGSYYLTWDEQRPLSDAARRRASAIGFRSRVDSKADQI